jgi:hypothetical protein
METSTITQREKVQKPTIYKKTNNYNFWDSQGPVLEHQERGTTKTVAVTVRSLLTG